MKNVKSEVVGVETEPNVYDKKTLSLFDLEGFYRHIEGNALTVIDACIPNKDQNKAAKSLMKQALQAKIIDLNNWVYDCERANKKDDEGNSLYPAPLYPFNSEKYRIVG